MADGELIKVIEVAVPGIPGPAGYEPQGLYNNDIQYQRYDGVVYNGIGFAAKQAVKGVPPALGPNNIGADSAYWKMTFSAAAIAQAAFAGGQPLTALEMLEPDVRYLHMYTRQAGWTDAQYLQYAIDQTAGAAGAVNRPIILKTKSSRTLDLAGSTINLRALVYLDTFGTTITQGTITTTDFRSVPFRAAGISNWKLLNLDLVGPGSKVVSGKLRYSEAYAIQPYNCSDFEVTGKYISGNAGVLALTCRQFSVSMDMKNLSGTGVQISGCEDFVVTEKVLTGAGFGVYCTLSRRGKVFLADKQMAENQVDPVNHAYIVSEYEATYKAQPFAITGVTWTPANGGRLLVALNRDPTVDTISNDAIAAPKLAIGNLVRPYKFARLGNGDLHPIEDGGNGAQKLYTIAALDSATKTVELTCPVAPSAAYTSSGHLIDMTQAIFTVGEEAFGATSSCDDILVHEIIAHRIGDCGFSLTGNNIRVIKATVTECALSGGQSGGRGNRIDTLISRSNGKWSTASYYYGAFGFSFQSSAGNVCAHSSLGKIVSRDFAGAIRINGLAREQMFVANGECNTNLMVAFTGVVANQIILMRATTGVPETYGSLTPAAAIAQSTAGTLAPDHVSYLSLPIDNTKTVTWYDGKNTWTVKEVISNVLNPAAPTQPNHNRVSEVDYVGAGVPVFDSVGPGYFNDYPKYLPTYNGPLILYNTDYWYWPNAAQTPSTTPKREDEGAAGGAKGVWWFARSGVGSWRFERVASPSGDWAMQAKRFPGGIGHGTFYCGQTVTDPNRLRPLQGKRVTIALRVFKGAKWSDSDQKVGLTIGYRTAAAGIVAVSGSSLIPATDTTFDTGSVSVTSESSTFATYIFSAVMPADLTQLFVRFTSTATAGAPIISAQGTGYTMATLQVSGGGSDPGKVLPAGTVTLTDGKVTAITISNAGANLTESPVYTIVGDGSGAVLTTSADFSPADTTDCVGIERVLIIPSVNDVDSYRIDDPDILAKVRLVTV